MVNLKQNQGMTLIELMIVVAILGIISAIAIPAYTGYIKTGRIQECQQEIASLALAQEEFFLEQRSYFEGTGTVAIETASNNLWAAAEQTVANRNCDYNIAGNPDIANSYIMTATGTNKLLNEGVVVTRTK